MAANVRWLKLWWPVLVWGALISTFSTGAFTPEHTSHVIVPVLRWLFPHMPMQTLELIHHVIRKCAHFAEYFILSLLILRAFARESMGRGSTWALLAILVVAAYASLDEFHQSFVPGRTALGTDVMIDSRGGVVAQIVAWVGMTWRNGRKASAAVDGLRD